MLSLTNINLIPVFEYNCKSFPPTTTVPVVILGLLTVPTSISLVDLYNLNKIWVVLLLAVTSTPG
jgi:hypothetical protein